MTKPYLDGPRMVRSRAIILGLLIAAAAISVAPSGTALAPMLGVTVKPTPLIHPLDTYAAAWGDGVEYLFGGGDFDQAVTPTNEIERYDPAGAGTATILSATMPVPGGWSGAVWTGSVAYIFGGTPNNQIVRFDPAGPSATLLSVTLPQDGAGAGTAAVWTGSVAYVFAVGNTNSNIVRFDPSAGTTAVVGALPYGMRFASAVWTGSHALIVGGDFQAGQPDVIEFDPATGTSVDHAGVLQHPVQQGGAAWIGGALYLIGGSQLGGTGDVLSEILRIDPATWTSSTVGHLPSGRGNIVAAYDGSCDVYVAGGDTTTGTPRFLSEMVDVNVCPPPVAAFVSGQASSSCASATFVFDASGSAGGITGWDWDFGDGATGSGETVSHTFTAEGPSTVTLIVSGPHGGASITQDLGVAFLHTCPPTIDPMPSLIVSPNHVVTVCAVGHAGMGGPLTYDVGAMPAGAVFGPSEPCMHWTVPQDAFGAFRCVQFTVTEAPYGLSASTCLRLDVLAPTIAGATAADSDGDGIADSADNCPGIANPDQADRDGDGLGDACRSEEAGSTSPMIPDRVSSRFLDADLDGINDAADNCPATSNPDQADLDHDLEGDACDLDIDGDGILDQGVLGQFLDNCPWKPNADQADSDGDGRGDACNPPRLTEDASPVRLTNPEIPHAASPWPWVFIVATVAGLLTGLAVAVVALGRRRAGN